MANRLLVQVTALIQVSSADDWRMARRLLDRNDENIRVHRPLTEDDVGGEGEGGGEELVKVDPISEAGERETTSV